MNTDDIIALASLVMTTGIFLYGIAIVRKNKAEHSQVNEAMRVDWEKRLNVWREKQESREIEQMKEIENIYEIINELKMNIGKEKGRVDLQFKDLNHSINNHSQMFLEISMTLKELPTQITNSLMAEMKNLKELFDLKIENIKEHKRNIL